jgi:hypothetical protein
LNLIIFQKKLPAGSLMATLMVILIIATTCSLLLLGVYHTMLSSAKDEIDQRLADDLQSGMELVMSQPRPDSIAIRDSALLFTGEPDSVYYTSESWGCFTAVHLRVCYKGRNKTTSFLHGASGFKYNEATVYLADHNKPLYLTGESFLEGPVYLPPKGLNAGFFQGEGFSKKSMIKGNIDSSSGTLPSLRTICKTYIQQVESDSTTPLSGSSIQHSFAAPYRSFSSPGTIDQSLKGKLVIVSGSSLKIAASAQLEDVILVAPFIQFSKGFKGSVQAFAHDSITAESGCRFTYPSALVCCSKPDSVDNNGASITLNEDVALNGIVLALTQSGNKGPRPVIKIKAGATVEGLVYSEGYTHVYGRVKGAVYTHFFLHQKDGAAQDNVLKDAVITSSAWYRQGIYSSVFTGAARSILLKWLY